MPQIPTYRLDVGPADAGRMIKNMLLSDAKMSRRLIRQLAHTNSVLRNGEPVYLTQRVNLGDEIVVLLPDEDSGVSPESMDLDIRYDDHEVVVVNKPAGVLTHPTAKEKQGSLLAGVRAYLGEPVVPHCVHRLDRDTSGLVLFAKHAHAHQLLDRALRAGHVHRVYIALAHISHEPWEDASGGSLDGWQTITLPIAQDPDRPSRRVIDPLGKSAVTHYRVIARAPGVGLLQVVLETGRTHQIRLHFASMGMPLLGEKDYTGDLVQAQAPIEQRGTRNPLCDNPHDNPCSNPAAQMHRQALHAIQLAWRHPVTGEFRVISAEPPLDIQETWQSCGGDGSLWHDLTTSKDALYRVEMLAKNLLR